MADFQLSGNTVISESGGIVSWGPGAPSGTIVQTVSEIRTTSAVCDAGNTNSDPGSNWVDVLSVNITPRSGTKCLIMVDAVVGSNKDSGYTLVRVVRDGDQLSKLTGYTYGWETIASGGTQTTVPYSRLIYDEHGADGSTQVTYTLQLGRQNSSYNSFIGRGYSHGSTAPNDEEYESSRATTITVMEIAQGKELVPVVPGVSPTAEGNNRPYFSAYMSVGQSVTNTTHTVLQFDTEVVDSDNCFSNYKFTPNVAGYYMFSAIAIIQDIGDNKYYYIRLRKNGTTYLTRAMMTTSGGDWQSPTLSTMQYANGTTDYFEIVAFQNNGNTRTIGHTSQEWSTFSAFRIF